MQPSGVLRRIQVLNCTTQVQSSVLQRCLPRSGCWNTCAVRESADHLRARYLESPFLGPIWLRRTLLAPSYARWFLPARRVEKKKSLHSLSEFTISFTMLGDFGPVSTHGALD